MNPIKTSVHNWTLIMPASQAALGQEEYEKVVKKATLKMDLVIVPIMVGCSHIFYIVSRLPVANPTQGRHVMCVSDPDRAAASWLPNVHPSRNEVNYLDRQNIASVKLANITTELGLSEVEYQTTVSIAFVGYSISAPRPWTPHLNAVD